MRTITVLAAIAIVIGSCGTQSNGKKVMTATQTTTGALPAAPAEAGSEHARLSISGKVAGIESGKDGYTATIISAENRTYIATISRINLQKSGGTYREVKEGDSVTVAGPFWKDEAGNTYITVDKL